MVIEEGTKSRPLREPSSGPSKHSSNKSEVIAVYKQSEKKEFQTHMWNNEDVEKNEEEYSNKTRNKNSKSATRTSSLEKIWWWFYPILSWCETVTAVELVLQNIEATFYRRTRKLFTLRRTERVQKHTRLRKTRSTNCPRKGFWAGSDQLDSPNRVCAKAVWFPFIVFNTTKT